MKMTNRIHAVIYTLIVLALCLSLYTNYEQADRAEHARDAIEHYEKGVSGCFESNTLWEQAYTECNYKLKRSESDTIKELHREIRQLEYNISRHNMETNFNSIDCNMESIMDNLDHMIYILDTKEEMKQQELLFNTTREALDICKTKI